MQKVYSRINWENYPSNATPINESNLNKIDYAVNEVDNRILTLDTAKLDKAAGQTMVRDVTFDETTGIFTIKYLNGSTAQIDTQIEKLAINFEYDAATQQLVITLDDGTKQYVDLSALITQYEFQEGDIVYFEVADGKVTANVKDGSITAEKLQPNYLADIQVEVAKAEKASTSASSSASDSASSAVESESYTHGGTGTRTGEDTDNGRYYLLEIARQFSDFLERLLHGDYTGAKGDKGDKGDTGPQGPAGADGAQGEQGIQGPKGDKGDKGDTGESGVVAPVSGFFTMAVDADGNLWAYSAEGGTTPVFEYDTDGNLYYLTEE